MKTILGLDLATRSTGYSIFNYKGKLMEYGLIVSNDKNVFDRIFHIYNETKKICDKHKVLQIVCEDVMLANQVNKKYAHDLILLQGAILGIALEKDLGFYHMMPSKWRSLAGIYKEKRTREELKREYQKIKAVELVNNLYSLNFVYDTKKHDDDICEAILINLAFQKLINGNDNKMHKVGE